MKKLTAEQLQKKGKNIILDMLHDVVHILVVVLLVCLIGFRIVVVSGPSMNQTLVDGDYLLLLSNILYPEPEQGDVVVANKQSFQEGELIIKRVIATEGQTVDIDFDAGIVYVDGEALDEPYTYTPTNISEGVSFPLEVAPGHVFLLGDNRNVSKDSRNPDIGQVDKREIVGKAIFLMLPGTNNGEESPDFSRIGALSK